MAKSRKVNVREALLQVVRPLTNLPDPKTVRLSLAQRRHVEMVLQDPGLAPDVRAEFEELLAQSPSPLDAIGKDGADGTFVMSDEMEKLVDAGDFDAVIGKIDKALGR